MTAFDRSRSLRRSYLEWVEEQVESYKESISRSELLLLAEEVVEDLRVNQRGQYQLTELLLCDAVDRRIARTLKLPGYRIWAAEQRAAPPAPVDLDLPPEDAPPEEEAEVVEEVMLKASVA